MYRTSLALNILLLFCILTSALLMLQLNQHIFFADQTNSNSIDAYMTQVAYTSFDQNGQVKSFMTASKMNHRSQQDTLKLFHPSMKIYTDKRIPWQVSSQYGISYHNN